MSNFDVHPEQYEAQLTKKSRRLVQMFEGFGVPELEVFESPPTHYRMRAEFRVWHDQGDLYYIMFDKESKERIRVDRFPQASLLINRAMPALMDAVRQSECLRKRLFQVDFLSTLSGELLVSLLYHRQLDEEWLLQATALKEALNQAGLPLDLIGRARKPKHALHRDFVIERLEASGRTYVYQQYENSFTQPNAAVAQHMLSWAIDCTRESRGDLLELYCGNGHFSLALAQNFGRVLATEVAKYSVRSAHFNIEANAIENVQVVRLSAQEVVEAMDGVREFRRLRNAGVDLSRFDFSTVFVDPPRAGMDPEGCAMVQRFEKILYVSCNPETLRDNLEILSQTHRVTRFAFFDQFPYTDHMEAGMLLERRVPLTVEGNA